MNNEDNRKSGIDIGQYICAILVMISHMAPFGSFNQQANYYAVNLSFRYAVPFFFICSAYFLYRNVLIGGKISGYLKRITMLYSVWTLIYILFSLPFTITITTVTDFLFRGIVFHLWFFPSLIFSIVFIFYFLNKVNSKIAWFIVCCLYCIGLLGDSYGNLLPCFPIMKTFININNTFFGQTRNGILFASIFIYIGVQLAKNESMFSGLNSKKKLIMLFASYAIWILEFILVTKLGLAWDLNLSIFIIPTATFFFLILIDFDQSHKINGTLCKKMSTVIYCSHILIANLLDAYVLSHITLNSLQRCIVVVLCTCVVSYLLVRISKSVKCLKMLY